MSRAAVAGLLSLALWCGCGEPIVVTFPGSGSGSGNGDGGNGDGGDGGYPSAVPCSPSNLCAAPLVCDVAGGCVECSTDANCSGATPACDLLTRRCVTCRGALGCNGGYVCSPSAPVCVLPCVDALGCPGFIDGCRAYVCSACNDHEDCGAGMFCDVPLGRCVACLSDGDCNSPTPKCQVATGTCVACVRNSDCPSGGSCFQGACRPPR